MKIYTKTGDKGKTSFLDGNRVSKSHYRLEVYGTVDELNSYVGLIRSHANTKKYEVTLLTIQEKLFTIGSHLAVQGDPGKFNLPEIENKDISFLEESIDTMEKKLPKMKNFVLPGGDVVVSHIHIARCICRRAERLVIGLNEKQPVENNILVYLNRLSDFLFVLARSLSNDLDVEEIPWIPRG